MPTLTDRDPRRVGRIRGAGPIAALVGAATVLILASAALAQAPVPQGALTAPSGATADGASMPSLVRGAAARPSEPGAAASAGETTAAAPDSRASGRVKTSGTVCSTSRGARICLTVRNAKVVKRCVTRGRTRTCTFFNASGAAFKRCATASGRTRCVRVRVARTSTTVGTTSPAAARGMTALQTTLSHGWTAQLMPSVGRLYLGDSGTCTATVVSRNLILTASHCVVDQNSGRYVGNPGLCARGQTSQCLVFVPGQTWDVFSDPASIKIPYGAWTAVNYWASPGMESRVLANWDMGQDWALVQLGPNAQGQYVGDVVPRWSMTWNLPWGDNSRAYLVGYPGGGFFGQAQGGSGRGQYFCDTRTRSADWRRIGTGYEMWAPCVMNQGASGGPWFGLDTQGRWTILGVNSQCAGGNRIAERVYCVPTSSHLRTPYFDSRFGSFWNAVSAQAAIR